MKNDLIPIYKDGKIFSVKSNKKIPVYENGIGIHEVLKQLHEQAIEFKRLEKKRLILRW